jgi:DNA repair exonuclease SbcCD ATPase subunit
VWSEDTGLEQEAERAQSALDETLAKVQQGQSEQTTWRALLKERQAAVADLDLAALTAAEAKARAEAEAAGADVDEPTIVAAREDEAHAADEHTKLAAELHKAEGALEETGGAAAEERARELDAALQHAHGKQAALEDNYEAWRLLAQTLKKAERTQATHLGSVLAPDLSARLQALTGQGYASIALDPHLGLDGVDAAGGRRDVARLSVGTREQLATLFRLCLAERLNTALLLDDQLVQSDPERLRWFRGTLRDTASKGVQILVLTCRPDDYLEPAASPAPHVVDLGAALQRAR